MKKILAGITVAFVLAAVVYAQAAITGKWQGETRNGAQIVLDLTATEKALTGTLTRNGESAAIADGKAGSAGPRARGPEARQELRFST